MADPIKVLRSLAAPLAGQYAIFERDQVLTHTQLNEVATWLDQQDRLTRLHLVGAGVIAGFEVSAGRASVTVGPGLGLTTDGDLVQLAEAAVFTRLRAYDETAPRYEPFLDPATGAQVVTGELLSADDPRGEPLAPSGGRGIPTGPLWQRGILAGRAVVLLMESTDTDKDLCTGAGCDNLGRERQHKLRVLLAPRADAARLAAGPVTAADRAAKLPELFAFRPALGTDLTTAEALVGRYRDANGRTVEAFAAACAAFADVFPEAGAASSWAEAVRKLHGETPALGVQAFYGFLKDLAAAWNELRDALLDDGSLPMPVPDAFPKHLGAGAPGSQSAPDACRTAFFPGPGDAATREVRARARFLATRLDRLVTAYAPPSDAALRVTPSQGEDRPLGDRAIPWYYRAPVAGAWNERLSARGLGGCNLGYRAAEYGGSARARAPLAGSLAGHGFFRVEGHLGRPVADVCAELRKLTAAANLPFDVHAVLVHHKKEPIRIRPGIRYTDLHRFHYLVRQEVALRLDEGQVYAERFAGSVKAAVDAGDVPAQTDGGASVTGAAAAARAAVGGLAAKAGPALAKQTYSAYRAAADETRWANGVSETLGAVGSARASLGKLSRTDFASPLDSLVQTTHPLWLDWLDDLLRARDDAADEKLLLSRFAADHPGLDHVGGAWRGGTFVLVYDDAQNVVADFALPYRCAEADEPEPVEPPLKRPPLRRPPDLDPIRVVRPVDLLVGTAVADRFDGAKRDLDTLLYAAKADLRSRLEVQSASIEGLVKGALSVREAAAGRSVAVATGDAVLDEIVRDVDDKRRRVEALAELGSRGDVTEEERGAARELLVKAQAELGEALGAGAERAVKQSVDTSSGAAAGAAAVFARGAVCLTDATAAATLGSRLEKLGSGTAGTPQKALIGGLQAVVGRAR